jgi:hypothetical protein
MQLQGLPHSRAWGHKQRGHCQRFGVLASIRKQAHMRHFSGSAGRSASCAGSMSALVLVQLQKTHIHNRVSGATRVTSAQALEGSGGGMVPSVKAERITSESIAWRVSITYLHDETK